MKRLMTCWLLVVLLLTVPIPALGHELLDRIESFTLDNGLRVLMLPEDFAPVVHFHLMFDVGGIDEEPGLGGIAHMVEHMAFKGTETIGTRDFETEEALLQELEIAADQYFAALEEDDEGAIAEAEQRFMSLREELQELATPDVLHQLFDQFGGVGMNAYTGYDRTAYFVSLPSGRQELWLRVYADILDNAVFRYFYEEVDVVKEERRQRNEDEPTGYLREHFLREAFEVHPYGRPLIGSMEEISNYRYGPAREFWDQHYQPNRAVLIMIGDIDPEADRALVEKYFGVLESEPRHERPIPAEPPQQEQRRVTVEYEAEPEIMVGFHKPTYPHRDAYVLDVIRSLLGTGRTSRLHARMVIEEEKALAISVSSSFPGLRDPNLLVFHGRSRHPHKPEDLKQLLFEEIAKLQQEPVDPWELEKVVNQAQASFIRNLASPSGLAGQLATYELFLDGYENILDYPDIIASITPEEIQEAANAYLTKENSVVGILYTQGDHGGAEQ